VANCFATSNRVVSECLPNLALGAELESDRFIEAPRVNNLRINLFGHSFGCKVVCSALQELTVQKVAVPQNISFNVVLLQAAFTTDALDTGGIYENVLPASGQRLRMLITRSDLDLALKNDFPKAQRLDLFSQRSDYRSWFHGTDQGHHRSFSK
jgi:hypothetical protein